MSSFYLPFGDRNRNRYSNWNCCRVFNSRFILDVTAMAFEKWLLVIVDNHKRYKVIENFFSRAPQFYAVKEPYFYKG